MIALIVGATGSVGKKLLEHLLASDAYTTVHSFARRSTGQTHPKLTEHTIDFEKLADETAVGEEGSKLRDVAADAVFITLGTTRADAGSAAKFERIDREYVLAAAKAARSESKNSQQLLYCSSAGAGSRSPFLYPKSKGLTEEALSHSGYFSTLIFRPGMLLNPNRPKARLAETVFGVLTKSVLSKLSDEAGLDVGLVGKGILQAALLGADKLSEQSLGRKPTGSAYETDHTLIVVNSSLMKLAAM